MVPRSTLQAPELPTMSRRLLHRCHSLRDQGRPHASVNQPQLIAAMGAFSFSSSAAGPWTSHHVAVDREVVEVRPLFVRAGFDAAVQHFPSLVHPAVGGGASTATLASTAYHRTASRASRSPLRRAGCKRPQRVLGCLCRSSWWTRAWGSSLRRPKRAVSSPPSCAGCSGTERGISIHTASRSSRCSSLLRRSEIRDVTTRARSTSGYAPSSSPSTSSKIIAVKRFE